MSKILITGVNGQLGQELKFLSPNHLHHNFIFADKQELDITDKEHLSVFIAENKVDFVINCAAYTAVDKAESDAHMAYKVNAEALGYISDACLSAGAKLIHISTDFVFDGSSSKPIPENADTNPISVYGKTKLEGELQALQINKDVVVIRTSWVYSSFGANFVKTIIRLCNERPTLNIIYDQIGTPTYARDLAEVLFAIVNDKEWHPGIYHYSNEGVASWYDFAIAIRDLKGYKTQINPIETHQYPTPATRPSYSVLNKKKIKDTYGITIPYWRDSLMKCIELL